MKPKKKYKVDSICLSCLGTGTIHAPGFATNVFMACHECHGSGTFYTK